MAPRQSTGGSSALLAAQRAIDSEDKYRASVKKLHALSKIQADNFVPDGDLEKAMEGDAEMTNFMEECRIRLKGIAEGNAKRMKEIDYYVEAVREVKNDVVRRQHDGDAEDEEAEAVNYEAAIHSAIERIRAEDENNIQEWIEQHPMVIEVRTTLGERVKSDDDDLEVVNNRDDVHKLKCPITATLFENPVKNKVCGHVYSRAGIQQVIKNKKTTCPIAGCTNNRLSMQQLEEDEETKMAVHRFKKKEELAKKKRALDDEADEDMGDGGFTMVQ